MMDPLYWQAVRSGIFGLLLFAALIFVPAGTVHYWQGWAFLAVFAATTIAFTLYLALYDKPLLERRIKAGPWHETESSQKIIVSLVLLGFFSLIVVSALDVRFGWSSMPAYVSLIGEALIVLSFLFIFWVVKVNSFAASTIQVTEDQKVVSTGPYAYVRHPMYSGALVLLISIPLSLGSWWALLLIVPFMPVLAWRVLDEERFLRQNLAGYVEYVGKVRYRLIPSVW
jgi:protein-S-isoprenylcysteine O-methyltransferase Ste14